MCIVLLIAYVYMNGEKKNFIKPVARFELATPCLQGRCNNHYATPARSLIQWTLQYKLTHTSHTGSVKVMRR